jgi:hypothetical protein
MSVELVHSGEPALNLNFKALHALIDAVQFRLAAWDESAERDEATMSDDEFSDLQNDMMYLGSVLTALEDELARRQASPAT